MSSSWILYLLIASLTGNPVLAAVVLLAGGFALDRFSLQILPSPVRWWKRLQRISTLRRTLTHNPNDRQARFALADLLLGRAKNEEALTILRPNLETDTDTETLFLMGRCLLATNHFAQAKTFFEQVLEDEPRFKQGDTHLELGRSQLGLLNPDGAIDSFRRFCQERPGSVEGQVMLATAFERAGKTSEAKAAKNSAWANYISAERFQKRRERFWAWRLRPHRPIFGAILILVGLVIAASVLREPLQRVRQSLEYPRQEPASEADDE